MSDEKKATGGAPRGDKFLWNDNAVELVKKGSDMSTQPTIERPAAKPRGNGQATPKPEKIPQHWGASAAKFYADQENELITVHTRGGAELRGYLIGVSQFEITLEREGDKAKVLILKHAIDWIEPG